MTSADRPIVVRCLNVAEALEYAALLEPHYPGRVITERIGADVFVSVQPA